MWGIVVLILAGLYFIGGKSGGSKTPTSDPFVCVWCGKRFKGPSSGGYSHCSAQCKHLDQNFRGK